MRTRRAPAVVVSLLLLSQSSLAFAQGPAAPPAPPAGQPAAPPGPPAPPAQPGQPAQPTTPAGPKPLSQTLTGDAKTAFDDALKLLDNGDYATALVKFQSAYDKSNDPRLLWNEAVCDFGLHHYVKAIALMNDALGAPGNLFTAEERAKANAFLQQLQSFVSKVTIEVNEPGASIYVDNDLIGTSPLAKPVPFDLGQHDLRVTKPGFVTFDKTETIQTSSDTTWAAQIVKEIHEGRVVINAGEKDTITVDNKPVGVGHFTGVVPSGGHQVRVTAPGMLAYQSEVLVRDNQTRTVDVTLQPEPKTGKVPVWAWVVGGAVVATGAAVGGYFLFKPKEEQGQPAVGSVGNVSLHFAFH